MRHGETGQTGFRSTGASKPSGQIGFLLPNPVKVPSSATRPAAGVTCLSLWPAEMKSGKYVHPHYMHDLQNKGPIKWAFCNRLILKSLDFCGQADTKGCARWKKEFAQEVRTGMHSRLFGLFVAELSTEISIARDI